MAFLLLENGIFRQKNACGVGVHAAAPDWKREP
jgi:hypothetical protein